MSFEDEHALREKKEKVVRKMKKEPTKKEGTESWVKTTSKYGFPKHIKVNRYY